jgi:tritrans,polycis-undecaprenyl-diphosphate synthase [geranylgeranyl-diphosphate specific]
MMPKHVGVILDGNRRYARQLMKNPWEGHKAGIKKSREVISWACERGVKYITAYVLSWENYYSRPKREMRLILKYLEEEMEQVIKDKNHVIHKNKVRVRFIGRTHVLPERMQKKLRLVQEITKNYREHHMDIALAYGGRQEIIDATRSILLKGLKGVIKPSDLDEKMIKQHLYTNGHPYPDLIIRTGGEQRLSNFLPFQSAYSELVFTYKHWPEITKKDFDDALKEFEKRKRRFGK